MDGGSIRTARIASRRSLRYNSHNVINAKKFKVRKRLLTIIFHVAYKELCMKGDVCQSLLDEVMKDEVYNAAGDVDEFRKKVNVYRKG